MNFDEVVEKYRGDATGITHLVVSREGAIVEEWYRAPQLREVPHMLHSATKSFVGTAAGLAVSEGLLSLEAPMIDYLPAHHAAAARGLARAIRVRDLLTMRTGHARGSSGVAWRTLTTSWIAEYLGEDIVNDPGGDFIYSSGTSHMLSAVVQGAVGEPVDEYLRPRIFEPLGFVSHRWARDPEGISSGGNGLSLVTGDLLKWGELYSQGGRWRGRELVPADWVAASTAQQVRVSPLVWDGQGYTADADPDAVSDDLGGYGYQIWRQDGAYFASGMFGQVCLVVPDARLVVAVNAALPRSESSTLVEDLLGAARERAAALDTAPAAREGLAGTYADGRGRRLRVTFDGPVVRLEGRDSFGPIDVTAGLGGPLQRTGAMLPPELHHSYVEASTPIVSSATLLSPAHLRLRTDFSASPFVDTLDVRLSATRDAVTFSRETNVNSGATGADVLTLPRVVAG